MTHKITPHKGGRTIKRSTDVTPETDALLRHLSVNYNISLGDLVEEAAEAKVSEIEKEQYENRRKNRV